MYLDIPFIAWTQITLDVLHHIKSHLGRRDNRKSAIPIYRIQPEVYDFRDLSTTLAKMFPVSQSCLHEF